MTLADNLRDFLLNILIIFMPFVIYPYLYKHKNKLRMYRLSLFLIHTFTLVMTMTFPVSAGGILYDFRSVPIALGILYRGAGFGLGLSLIAILYRYFLAYPNTAIYAVSFLVSIFTVSFLARRFRSTASVLHKIGLSILVCTLIKLITIALYLVFVGQIETLFEDPLNTFMVYVLQALMISISVYIIEFIENHYNMEEELLRNEKAGIVNHIAASVAHEIRNPLTSVRGFIQLIERENVEAEKRDYYLKMCLEELDRAQNIITDYLTLARPEPEVVEKIRINDEVHYIVNVLNSYANFNQTEIISSRYDETYGELNISGDRSKLRQALINIGKNAIEAMPNGGVLEIHVNKVGRDAVVSFADTGTGMTQEQIKRLGTPYYSTKEKGTGLGTMVSFNIIKKMNGKIEINSEVGKGTLFKIVFPIDGVL